MTTGLIAQKFSISNIETGSLANRPGDKPESYKPSFSGGLLYPLLTSGIWLRIMQKSHWTHPSQVLSANCFTGQSQTLAPSHCCLMSKFTFIVVEYISLSSRITRPFWFQEIAPGHQCLFCPYHLRIMLPPFPSWKCNSLLFPLQYFLQE